MRAMRSKRLHVALSFGGTKIGVALLDYHAGFFVARSERIEWRLHPGWHELRPLDSLLAIAVNEVAILLEKGSASISDVARIGIAWPGPGEYDQGILKATFIPGLGQDTNVHQMLRDAFEYRFGPEAHNILILSCLDAHARALGELSLRNGAFAEERSALDGVIINIATGVAGAIIRSGRVMRNWPGMGSTYGQLGRFALRNQCSEKWVWRPTMDGSIPFRRPEEVRLTELCGGPALWIRYSHLSGRPHPPGERDVAQERLGLRWITQEAYAQNPEALAFVRAVGSELAGAIACVLNAFQLPAQNTRVVLTGGVGEFFGAPPQKGSADDVLLAAIGATGLPCPVVRSRAGIDAEYAGTALLI